MKATQTISKEMRIVQGRRLLFGRRTEGGKIISEDSAETKFKAYGMITGPETMKHWLNKRGIR